MPNDLPNPSINNSHANDIYENAVLKLNELAAMDYESEYARAMTLKPHRDFINAMDTAEKEGIEIGIDKREHKKSLEIAKTMLAKNFDIQTIMEITGLPENIITTL